MNRYQIEPESDGLCVMCDSEDLVLLGTLGTLKYARCRDCGADQIISYSDATTEDYFHV